MGYSGTKPIGGSTFMSVCLRHPYTVCVSVPLSLNF
jgi:hypothetical protein